MCSGPARVLACLSVLLAAAPVADATAATAAPDGIAFDAYSPLATATRITRHTQSPITFDRLQCYALAEVDTLLAADGLDDAGTRLGEIDLRWGGLAAPRTVALARRLAALRQGGEGGADGE